MCLCVLIPGIGGQMVAEPREREKVADKEVCQQAGSVTKYFTPSLQ